MMATQQLTIYETWDDFEPPDWVHSRLYTLEPLGLGTAQVESLTSYVARLAVAHRVSVSTLVLEEILPLFGQPKARTSILAANSCSLLRVNDLSKEFVWILQRLTGCLDLPYLTILPWASVMTTQETVRPHRAWCSGCLEEQRTRGEGVYEFLWWSFQAIKICPRHAQPLQMQCPHCDQQQPWLGSRSQVGYCSACQTWLGIVPDPHSLSLPAMADIELEWQHWLVAAIGELLAAGPALRHVPLRERLVAGLSNCCNQVTGGNVTQFAKILTAHNFEITASYLYQWLVGGHQPSWQQLFQLCFCLGTKPLTLLTNSTVLRGPLSLRTLSFLPPPDPKPIKPALIRDQLEKSLNAIVAADENPPPSLKEVSRRLNLAGTNSLVRYFPEQCALIVERYRTYRQAKKEERLRLLRENVRQATFDVHAQGVYPSKKRVDTQLGKRASMRNPDVRAFWKEAIRELGLDS
jgi:hypothetical protein